MTPGGMPGCLEQLHQVVRREHRARRRLPHDGVAHQRRRGRQVRGDRREVERRHRVDESFERAVLELIPHRVVADRLLGEQLLGVVHVEAPEVDDLAGGVDLGLEHRLRLPEHRRAVDGVAPRRGQQFGGLQEHGRAIVERPRATTPCARRAPRRPPAARARAWPCDMCRARGDGRAASPTGAVSPGADLLAADDERNVDLLGGHRVEPRLERRALRRARRVRPDGFVDRRRNAARPLKAAHGRSLT